ncbi:MAG: ABC transporter permease [Erysipelotrichales bacterium]|nr:ABC transporter permease [Erysipelotrichales bacterium]
MENHNHPMTPDCIKYLQGIKRKKIIILISQIALLLFFLLAWELLSKYRIIDPFIFSSPSRIYNILMVFLRNNELFQHIGASLWTTVLGIVLGTGIGIIIGIILYMSDDLAKILDPFLIVGNALPKTALAPIFIIWFGTNTRGVVVVAISMSLILTILSSYNYFKSVDPEKIKMMKSFGASKWQTLYMLILPANIENIFSIIKINIGMSFIGVIVGEFVVSRRGLGFLITYGTAVFNLDLVYMSIIALAVCTFILYGILSILRKFIIKKL